MQVLSDNINEKKEFPVAKVEERSRRIARRISVDLLSEHKVVINEVQEDKPHTALRFTFTMESMVVSLFKSGNEFVSSFFFFIFLYNYFK